MVTRADLSTPGSALRGVVDLSFRSRVLAARCCRIAAIAHGFGRKKGDLAMPSNIDHPMIIQRAIENYLTSFAAIGISLRLRRNFSTYVAIRRANGDTHLNQTFDPHT